MHHPIFVTAHTLHAQVAHAHCSYFFPHGGKTVPGRCFTVENETKETDNDNKIAETATTDTDKRLCERMGQLSFGLKEFKNICYQS